MKMHRKVLMAAISLAAIVILLVLSENNGGYYLRSESESSVPQNSEIVFSVPPGFYDEEFELTIQAPTDEIYYTTDGTDPDRNAAKYSGPLIITDATPNENIHSMRTDTTAGFDIDLIEKYSGGQRELGYKVPDYPVDKCTMLRVCYYDRDGSRSEIETACYFVGYSGREGYGQAKVLSIVTDPDNLFDYDSGIYVLGKTFENYKKDPGLEKGSSVWWWWEGNFSNSGRDWEREVSLQLFDESGTLLLSQDAGIRIQGGGSRGFLPKSLNLYARREYDGNTIFQYDVFGTGYYARALTLTSCGDDYYTKMKDRIVSEQAADQGFSVMHYEPCILFLDGEYWGFFYLTEKYDEKYFSYYYKIPENEVVEIKNGEISCGEDADLIPYEYMKEYIEGTDMTVDENYQRACEMIDIDSFMNYYAALIYCGREGDWPQGNYALWHTRDDCSDEYGRYGDGRWRWVLFDVNSAAISYKLTSAETLGLALKNSAMFRSLYENEEFRQKFTERLLEYGQTIFSSDTMEGVIDGYMEEMTRAMNQNYRRFLGSYDRSFEEDVNDNIRYFFNNRYDYVTEMIRDHE